MRLELLSNELLLDLFEYIPTVDLFRCLQNLNARINDLLFVRFRSYQLDLRSISKHDFDFICREHIPLVIDRIVSLHLSDDDRTPLQLESFLSRGFDIKELENLRSLSLHSIDSEEVLRKWTTNFSLLHHLTRLKITTLRFASGMLEQEDFSNKIWSLPKLTHLYFGTSDCDSIEFYMPTTISTTIECLSLGGGLILIGSDTFPLFQSTPHLRRLALSFEPQSDYLTVESPALSLTHLTVKINRRLDALVRFLQSTPNLSHLSVETEFIEPDGHDWEQIINGHLPKLTTLRLKMEFDVPCAADHDQNVNRVLDSFRSSFWLETNRWFVQCDWYPSQISSRICFYTLPYDFRDLAVGPGILTASTCPHENFVRRLYDRVDTLFYSSTLIKDLHTSSFRLRNIRHLYLSLPIDEEHFSSIVPSLRQLITLRVYLWCPANEQLKTLINRASHLLMLSYDYTTHVPAKELLMMNFNLSIRHLNLEECCFWFSEEQCIALSRSSLAKHCHTLRIRVKSRTSILHLIKCMVTLRALKVICDDDCDSDYDYFDDDPGSFQEDLVLWLRRQLPTVFLITGHVERWQKSIRLWLR